MLPQRTPRRREEGGGLSKMLDEVHIFLVALD